MKNSFKRIVTVLILVALLVVAAYVLLRILDTSEETSTLSDSEVIEKKVYPVGQDMLDHIASKADFIRVDNPQPGAVVGETFTVSGEARGMWYFEGSFLLLVTNWDGLIIHQQPIAASSYSMTTDFVPFEETVILEDIPVDNPRGYLIFQKDNPSGLPEHDDALEVPIYFF